MNSLETTRIEAGLRRLGEDLPDVSRLLKARVAAASVRALVERRRRAELPRLHALAVAMVVAGLLGGRVLGWAEQGVSLSDMSRRDVAHVAMAGTRSGRPEAGNWWTRSTPSLPLDPGSGLSENSGLSGKDPRHSESRPETGVSPEWTLVEATWAERGDFSRAFEESAPLRRNAGWRSWARLSETDRVPAETA